jgi:chemotaxis signal transduction protein
MNTKSSAARTTDAWLLDFGLGQRAAVGEAEIVHLLTQAPQFYPVPRAPVHCRNVILWEDRVLPVADLPALASAGRSTVFPASVAGMEHLVAVVAYASGVESEPIHYGALLLAGLPDRASVSDDQACDADDAASGWSPITTCCFRHPEHGSVPIVDLRRVFASVPLVS